MCRRLRIPVNVIDAPQLCTFTLLSVHTDGPLQIGVTTSGNGCKFASRIRREISASLPDNIGRTVERLGKLRRRLREEDGLANESHQPDLDEAQTAQPADFNRFVNSSDIQSSKTRRIRWLSQMCEYWPLSRLCELTDDDIAKVFEEYKRSKPALQHLQPSPQRRGKVVLAGTGPGHPEMLTLATLKAINAADVVLADKLVPAAVMELVPRRADVHISRKFPGNADNAQNEFLELGLEGVKVGKLVVRLKQGDPYIFGRGAEEFAFFKSHGFTPLVLPGITSALSAPLFSQIPPTHRAVSDEVLICTGTGRHGASPDPPAYLMSRTVVFLMALHRLSDLVRMLVSTEKQWPPETPCAIVERASCRDQRIIRTSLEHICAAFEEEGSRPPGLLIVGRSCGVLHNVTGRWIVEDGFRGLDGLAEFGVGSRILDSCKCNNNNNGEPP